MSLTTRIVTLVLLGLMCIITAWALTDGSSPLMRDGGRAQGPGNPDVAGTTADSSEIEANADGRASGSSEIALPKPPSSALNSPGEDFDFSSYLKNGRVTIVYFYADWCPACNKTSPLLATINREDPAMQVVFLDIDDWNSPIADRYGVSYVPYLRVYDPRGSLVLEGRAASDWVWQGSRRSPIR